MVPRQVAKRGGGCWLSEIWRERWSLAAKCEPYEVTACLMYDGIVAMLSQADFASFDRNKTQKIQLYSK